MPMPSIAKPRKHVRVAVLSDIHLELPLPRDHLDRQLAALAGRADILVAAGDIGQDLGGLWWLASSPIPVVYILGNAEISGGDYDALRARASRLARSLPAVTLLDDSAAEYDVRGTTVRVLGSTLWTDYALIDGDDREAGMRRARAAMVDYQTIRIDGRWWDPEDAAMAHGLARAFLATELVALTSELTVVVTHFSPTPLAIARQYRGSTLNGCWHSDLSMLMDHVDLWVHGGAHHRSDLRIGGCRVVANPRRFSEGRRYRIRIFKLPVNGGGR